MILPPPAPSLNDTIALLAQLPAPEYDRVRRAEAQRLKIQVKTLDDQVKAARLQSAPTNQPPFQIVELRSVANRRVQRFKRPSALHSIAD